MKAFDARAYSISDFQEWYEEGKLVLSPKFQRRSVWSGTAKAFLADTIIRGKPFPKVIIMQKFVDGRTIRVVVDGQQRLRSILEFLSDGVKISRAHNKELGGKVFSQLPKEIQDEFKSYEVGCDVLSEAPISELLDIFARINRYSIKLNSQELRNANFSGFFKTAAFNIGYDYVDYWLTSKVLTQTTVNRMGEAELASDLLVAFIEQVQSNKAVERLYKEYEEKEDGLAAADESLRAALDAAARIFPEEELSQSAWRKKHLYYTLITVVGHISSPLSNLPETHLIPNIFEKKEKLRSVLNSIGTDHEQFTPQPMRSSAPEHLKDFIRNSTLATTDTKARVERAKFVISRLEEAFDAE
ncbi:DUF262 domain-containing protein [Leisingera caerulea]|uniref:DUF262 domain-containing protein n=1 Tax=Leisingera caerulea TaxID=506591 RepID=A0ABY5WYY4_LEICA|nr:DUF262 domain-containing protein [Leisingera caerulea]UWQ59541.1 DUF262 domain-containing protein [Leisingera caerulea]